MPRRTAQASASAAAAFERGRARTSVMACWRKVGSTRSKMSVSSPWRVKFFSWVIQFWGFFISRFFQNIKCEQEMEEWSKLETHLEYMHLIFLYCSLCPTFQRKQFKILFYSLNQIPPGRSVGFAWGRALASLRWFLREATFPARVRSEWWFWWGICHPSPDPGFQTSFGFGP